MSFYTGKDKSGKAIMHITNGVTPQAAMKAGVLANSVFHSSLPYLEIKEYTPISVTYMPKRYYFTYGDGPTIDRTYKFLFITMGIDFINGLEKGQCYFIVMNGRIVNLYSAGGIYGWCPGPATSVDDLLWVVPYHPSNANPTLFIDLSVDDASIWLGYVFNLPDSNIVYNIGGPNEIKVYAFKNLFTTGYKPFAPTNNEIFIDNDNFIVRGKDLYSASYLQKGVVNAVDAVATTTDLAHQVTLVNTRATGPLSIHSHATESKIMRGEHTLFTSLQLPKSKYLSQVSNIYKTLITINIEIDKYTGYGAGYTVVGSGQYMSVGDMFILVPIDNAESNSGQVFVYKEGFIGYCFNSSTSISDFFVGWQGIEDNHVWLTGSGGQIMLNTVLSVDVVCDWVDDPYSFYMTMSMRFNIIKFY